MASDDDIYDDVLDESFEFDDEEYDDLDLDSDIDSDDYDDFGMDDDEAGFDDAGKSSSRKGFNLDFNTIVIIGAVVVGGVIMMYQVTSKKPAPKAAGQEKFATALQMSGAFEGPGAIGEEVVIVPKDAGEQEGFLFDHDSIDVSVEDEENALPMPSPITVSTDNILNTVDEDLNVEVLSTVDVIDVEENIEIVATEEIIPIIEPEEILVAEVTTVEPFASEVAIVASEMVNIEATKLQSMLSRIEAMEAQMSEVQQSHSAEIQIMEAKIASLTKNQKRATKQSLSSNKVQKSQTVKKPAPVTKRWELRAAQPGRAWVSLSGQKDMRPLVVGDQLSGIGRIQNITYVYGRWTVQGTTGKITQ